jgi:hypothetical protein
MDEGNWLAVLVSVGFVGLVAMVYGMAKNIARMHRDGGE